MRRFCLLVAALVCVSSAAFGQTPTICVYSTEPGDECLFVDTPGSLTFHVFLIDAPGATAASFSAPKPACFTDATWVGDALAWPVTLGDSQTQVSIGFGQCLSGTVPLLGIVYQTTGATGSDCDYPILNPEGVDCNQGLFTPATAIAHINSAQPCDCALVPPTPILEVTPTQLRYPASVSQRVISIRNVGPGTLDWQASASANWITFSQNSGSGDADVTVFVDRTSLVQGSYLKTINVTSNGGFHTILGSIEVGQNSPPRLGVNPSSLTFEFADDQKTLNVSNLGGGDLDWNVTPSAPWITATPGSGTNNVGVTVVVDRSGLADGTYNEQLDVTSNGGSAIVPVEVMVLTQPLIDVTPTALSFAFDEDDKTFQLSNTGAGTLNWSITATEAWVTVDQPVGATAAGGAETITVTIDRSTLPEGDYTPSVNIVSDGGNAVVALDVEVDRTPVLFVSSLQLSFNPQQVSQPLAVKNIGAGVLNWAIASDQPWLTVTPDTGSEGPNEQTLTSVVVDRAGLADGTYNGTLTVTSDGGSQDVPVEMAVATSPVLQLSPTSLVFSPSTTERVFNISNVGFGTLTWSVAAANTWIGVDPASGTGNGPVTVTIDAPNAPSSAVNTAVTVTSNGGTQNVAVLWRPTVSGPGGALGLYADPGGGQSCITDEVGLITIYAVHTQTPGATAVQFAAPLPVCWNGSLWLSDTPQYAVSLGNSQTGAAVGYGACVTTNILVLVINVFGQGLTGQSCCAWTIAPDPNVPSGQIEVVDCAVNLLEAEGLTSFVSSAPCDCVLVATEKSTWGAIKALYLGDSEMQRLRRMQNQ